MGSTRLDLRGCSLPPGALRIHLDVVMGEARIVVPRGLPVQLQVTPIMGDANAKRDVSQRVLPGQPHVIVEGVVIMGSVVVVAQD
jgi:predicted membrane protein